MTEKFCFGVKYSGTEVIKAGFIEIPFIKKWKFLSKPEITCPKLVDGRCTVAKASPSARGTAPLVEYPRCIQL